MKGISILWFLITVLTNTMWFSVVVIWLWQKPQVYTRSKNTKERESVTPQVLGLCCNIFHSDLFYIGFKHAISQFNPIFPAFGALQWNRFRLILNIWYPLPLETPQQSSFFFYRDLLKTSLPCPSANHYQLCSMNIVIDNEEAGQQIKCQVWLEAWCLIICS